jgi:XisH protein
MPALDRHHVAVRNALIKDGWTVTADPLTLRVGVDRVHIDLAAERMLIAERGARKIAVEIKTFSGASKIADLEEALGQYVLYRMVLRRAEPDRDLYLAVP